jgi:predicted HicB family RNase H-like nuclease
MSSRKDDRIRELEEENRKLRASLDACRSPTQPAKKEYEKVFNPTPEPPEPSEPEKVAAEQPKQSMESIQAEAKKRPFSATPEPP